MRPIVIVLMNDVPDLFSAPWLLRWFGTFDGEPKPLDLSIFLRCMRTCPVLLNSVVLKTSVNL